ncbi:hypothetical protein AYO39_00410 [Actinobacteria bacterium SCGC AG-212-D09]|nr:hypothetical protein AYO39_00410 [Actinobacteria bacterium SCGC AG-212-D09]
MLADCWAIANALPTSGVLDRGRRPYRAIRFERKLDTVANDPRGLLGYIRGMARRTSEGLESLVEYNRVDLSVEMLIMDESKVYAPLFTAEDRAAARAKLAQRTGQVEELAQRREEQVHDAADARRKRVDAISRHLPEDLDSLRTLSGGPSDPETAIALNAAILKRASEDVVAMNRLGRAYESVGALDDARDVFCRVLVIDPTNTIAAGRLRQLKPRP